MNRKTLALLAAAIAVLGAAAAWLIARDPQGTASPGPGSAPSPPVEIARERPPPPVDQAQLDRMAQAAASRDQVLALRTAYEGGRPDARATERLAAALRQVWPSTLPRWSAPCRSRICRLSVEQAPPDWATTLQQAAPVTAVVDRLAIDPDVDGLAYLLLAAENAPSGAPALAEVERRLTASPEVQRCLQGATQAGTVEYELTMDTTGITYVRGGTADVEAQSCVEAELASIVTSTARVPKVKTERRRITLRTR